MAIYRLILLFALLAIMPATQAQTFPKLTGRVVDDAALLSPPQEQAITAKLAALEQQSGRQLVVATIPTLQDYEIADYGYRLGRAWGIGDKAKNDGALLIVAPNERKIRIEVGYGMEGLLTDALSAQIIRDVIAPRFKAGDMPGGIDAGVDEIGKIMTLPPEEVAARAAAATAKPQGIGSDNGSMAILWVIAMVVIFVVLAAMRNRGGKGKRYRGGSGLPIILWGPSDSGWGSGGGSGWGGGGFSGGGGSFGGGGASGDW